MNTRKIILERFHEIKDAGNDEFMLGSWNISGATHEHKKLKRLGVEGRIGRIVLEILVENPRRQGGEGDH